MQFSPIRGEYRTTRGHAFSFAGWTAGDSPIEAFDAQEWVRCLHACMLCRAFLSDAGATLQSVEDDGLLHELLHLASGVDICTHNSVAALRDQVRALQEQFGKDSAVRLLDGREWNGVPS